MGGPISFLFFCFPYLVVAALCLDVCLHGVEAIHDAGHQPKAAAISPRALAGALILTPARPFIRNDAAARSEGTATARRSAWERRRCSSQRREATPRFWASGWRQRGSGQRDGNGARAEDGDGVVLEQKTAAALSRPCCWAAQHANEMECLGYAPLDGSERQRCSDCREQSRRPTAEDLIAARGSLPDHEPPDPINPIQSNRNKTDPAK